MQVNANCDVELPLHTRPLTHQVAGHIHGKSNGKLGVIKHEDGCILKPFVSGDGRGGRERWFFEYVTEKCSTDPIITRLSVFLPKYQGTWIAQVNSSNIEYMRLEDIADQFDFPCNMDVKIGAITYDPSASLEKVMYEQQKYPLSTVIGFRIVGIRVFNECTNSYVSFDRSFGKKQTLDTILDALSVYICRPNRIAALILSGFIHRLKAIENWFSVQRQFAFYASSLLFFYEGNSSVWASSFPFLRFEESVSNLLLNNCSYTPLNSSGILCYGKMPYMQMLINDHDICHYNQKCVLEPKRNVCDLCGLDFVLCNKMQSESLIDVRMIDFAHVYTSDTEDSNYLFGLRKLLSAFIELNNKILNEHEK